MFKIKLTEEQLEDFAAKIFDLNFPDKEFGEFKDQDYFTRHGWINDAYDAVDGYNCVAKNVDFPGISVMKNCCMICKHVDLHRPACNLRGDDICLDYVCSEFEIFEFEDEDEDEDEKEEREKKKKKKMMHSGNGSE